MLHIGRGGVGRQVDLGKHSTRRGSPALAQRAFRSAPDRGRVVFPHQQASLLVEELGSAGEEQLQVVVDLVIVPTVERSAHGLVWSMAMAGGTPSTASTAGRSMQSRNWRA